MPQVTLKREVTEESCREGAVEAGDYCIKEVRGKKRIIIFLGVSNPYPAYPECAQRSYNWSEALHKGKPTKDALTHGVYISDDKYLWAFFT